MKLSIITTKILQYFSRLSEFIYFNVENKGFISLHNQSKDLYCYYILNDKEKEIEGFILYHYDEILEMIKTLDAEEVEYQFDKDSLIIKDKKTTFSYRYANKDLYVMNKNLKKLPSFDKFKEDIEFFVKGNELYKINKIMKSMKMEDFSFIFENGEVHIHAVNQSRIKDYKQKIDINNLVVNEKGDFVINMFISSLRDLNFTLDYKVKVYKNLNLLLLHGIINIKKDKKVISREFPFYCLVLGKK